MSALSLLDPQSGATVRIALLELPQRCALCGRDLEGQWGMTTGERGWSCLSHGPRLLMSLKMAPAFVARAAAREQLRGAAPGDRTIVSGEMLAALGLDA